MKNIARTLLKNLSITVSLLILLFISSQHSFGQATTGTLRGTVIDPIGGLVPGATVVAKNQATGVSAPSATTNESGFFNITNLLPGTYEVTVTTASGFKTSTSRGVQIRLGLDTDLRIDLQLGSAAETVTIVAGGEEVVQTNSEISSSFDTRKVADLPSNAAGGGIDTLALQAPGVTPGFGNVNSNGTTLSVNGNRARSNNFTIDGTDNNDLTIGGPSFFVSNADTVQEFQVITNNFSAQYGRNQGAIVNIITKSGSNEFSGSAFIYHRNSSLLDAQTNIERRDPDRSKRDKFISNVYGGTFGGPIVKNRAFFFGSYQGIKQRENFTARGGQLAILPSEFDRLRAAFPNNPAIQALTRQSAFALTNLGNVRQGVTDRVCISLTPATNCQTTPGGNTSGFFAAARPIREFPLPFDQQEFSLRGDVNLTPKDNISARYLFQDSNSANALGGSSGFTGDIPARSQNMSGFYTRQISSNIVNNFQATFQRLSVNFGGGCTDPLQGCIPDPLQIGEAFTNITFGGIRGTGGTSLQTIGGATNLPQGRIVDVYQFSDKVAWNVGNHALSFGADLRKLDTIVPFLPNINGVFRFNTVASLINNQPSSVTLADGNPIFNYKQFDRFFFFQDDWRIRPNFTLNLGVRYEFTGQPVNQLNDLTVARESDPATALYRQSLPIEARTFPRIPADKNNFAPRLGFAWSPDSSGGLLKTLLGNNSATVIRGGFSMAYDPAFYNIFLNISTSAPTVFLDTIAGTTANPAPGLPTNPIGSAVRTSAASRLRRNTFDPRLLIQTIVPPDFRSPYSLQFSFGIQRQINSSNVFEIRYVGNRGRGLFQTVNRNPNYANLYNGFSAGGFNFPSFRNLLGDAPPPQVCVNDPATPDNEAACNGRLLPGQGVIRSRENTANSQYDSLQTRYNGRFINKDLNFGASYTFSKALDNASEIFSFGESAIAQNVFDIEKGERSFSGFDRRHAFSMNFIYEVPFYKSQNGFLGKLLGGFQINGTYNLASGRRYTPSQFFNTFIPSYQDQGFSNTLLGLDNLRPFLGNPSADIRLIGITSIDAQLAGLTTATSPTGFYSLNEFNTTGNAVPVSQNDVRFIFNGPGAALRFGTPFGNVPRNSVLGPTLNQMNLGVFKTTNITEKVKIQLRAEAFNVLNRPNSGFGVAAGSSLPDIFIEDAGITGTPGVGFADKRETELSSRRIQLGLRIIF